MDHMEIGSGLLQMIIANLIKRALESKARKPLGLKITFGGPITFTNDGEDVTLKIGVIAKMSAEDFKTIITSLID